MFDTTTNHKRLNSYGKILIVLLVSCLGIWGCARKPMSRAGETDRVRILEANCKKLEKDLRAMTTARDKFRKELLILEEESARMQKEIAGHAAVVKERDEFLAEINKAKMERDQVRKQLVQRTSERDDLRQQITQRINERDAVLTRCEKLRKNLQQILTQDDNPAAHIPNAIPANNPNPGPALGTQG